MGFMITPRCKCIEKSESYCIGLGIKDFEKVHQNELAYCDSCKMFDVVGESDMCSCGGNLKRVYTIDMLEQGVSEIKCPRCNSDMQIEVTGLWD